jgi:hypothetical protein
MRTTIVAMALMFAPTASADELRGRVLDETTNLPVSGALVTISAGERVQTLNTDADGSYVVQVEPGTYDVTVANGKARSTRKVTVSGVTSLEGKLDAGYGEVIVIRDKIAPPTPPKPTNYKPRSTPEYSDAAVLQDAWTKAHLLLDIDEHGVVRRYKFLKRPGFDLEEKAVREIARLQFNPALDRTGKPMRAWAVWSIEWPSAAWLTKFTGTYSGMPPVVGVPPRRLDAGVPCKDDNKPLVLSSMYSGYRDCSKPDLRNASAESWQDLNPK